MYKSRLVFVEAEKSSRLGSCEVIPRLEYFVEGAAGVGAVSLDRGRFVRTTVFSAVRPCCVFFCTFSCGGSPQDQNITALPGRSSRSTSRSRCVCVLSCPAVGLHRGGGGGVVWRWIQPIHTRDGGARYYAYVVCLPRRLSFRSNRWTARRRGLERLLLSGHRGVFAPPESHGHPHTEPQPGASRRTTNITHFPQTRCSARIAFSFLTVRRPAARD